MKKLRYLFEYQIFGVCTALGRKMGISNQCIRMWFIYISFFTFGSPVIIYFVLAFWRKMRKYMRLASRNPIRWND
jgi:phage shock protein PspC (stress-responsive transcriptional regulator)